MDQGGHASIALLMLDIASAKSTLEQLQQTAETATTEHQRAIEKLDSFRKEYDVSPLYAKGTTAGAKITAHQLQMLHTENLQLKSLLKQEMEARQQLEHQHSALLTLLRNSGMQKLLASSLDAGAAHMGGSGQGLRKHTSSSTSSNDGADNGTAAPTQSSTTGIAVALREGPLGSLEPSLSSQQGVQGSKQGLDRSLAKVNPLAGLKGSINVCQPVAVGYHPSAYFPSIAAEHQFETPKTVILTTQDDINLQQAAWPQQHPAAHENLQASQRHKTSAKLAGHLQQQHMVIAAAESTGRSASPTLAEPTTASVSAPHIVNVAALHQDISASESLGSSSSQSVVSDLLDSEDLEELAGLCDGLISQASNQRLAAAAAHCPTFHCAPPAEAPAASGNHHATVEAGCTSAFSEQDQHQQQYQSQQHPAPGTSGGLQQQRHKAESDNQQQHFQQKHKRGNPWPWHCAQQSTSSSSCCSQQSHDVDMPGPDVFASEVCSLHQQVAASDIDLCSAAAAVEAALVGASSGRAPEPQNASSSLKPVCRSNPSTNAIDNDYYASAAAVTSSQANHVTAAVGDAGAGVADLQQQLAARMAEVKQQLSNICSIMLEDVLADGGSSAGSPSAAGTAAGGCCVQEHGPWKGSVQEQQQALQQQPGVPAAAATCHNPPHWHHASGGLHQPDAAADSCSTTSMGKPVVVASDVQASGFVDVCAAPSSCTSVGCRPSSSLRPPNRARVGGPALWSGAKDPEAAATTARQQSKTHNRAAGATSTSFRAPAFTASSAGSSQVVRTGAFVATDSDSSWATICEDGDEAEEQQQQQQESQRQYGRAKHQHTQAELRTEAHSCPIRAPLHNGGLPANGANSTFSSDEGSECDDCQTPPRKQHHHQRPQVEQQQRPADLDSGGTRETKRQQWGQATLPYLGRCGQQHHTLADQQQGAAVSDAETHQDSDWGASTDAHGGGASGRHVQQANGRGVQHQEHHQRPPCRVSESLEGVLFGLKGRVAAEVSQTFSPLKAGGGAAGCSAPPGSPVTPLKPRNL